MIELQRLTTEYIDIEDRIRLSGETRDGATLVLWMTRRLLDRMVPPLVRWIEKRDGDPLHGELMQCFAQQSALSRITPQARVMAGDGATEWLIREVDFGYGDHRLRLTFRAPGGAAGIGFPLTGLRQWLAILHRGYVNARWPLDAWPRWIVEQGGARAENAAALH